MNLRAWGVFSIGFLFAGCANPVEDQTGVDDQTPQGGGSLAPAPVKGGYNGNVPTGMPGVTPPGGSGGTGGTQPGGGSGGGVEPPTHPEPGLTAYYDFDSTTGYVFDVSGSGNHGTPSSAGVSLAAPGHSGQAASFTGGQGNIVVTAKPSLDFNTGATIEFWIRLSSVASGTILSRGSGWGTSSVRVRTTQGNVQVVFTRAGSGSAILTSNPNTLSTGWSHVAIVNDGSELKLYIDGALNSSVAGGYLGALASNLVLGKNESTDMAFSGSIDELKWWTVARTPPQICADAGGSFNGTSCSLP